MNPKYQITIVWSQEDECYLVSIPDFADEIMQPVSHGNTYQEALQNGLEVMEELILNLQSIDKSLPIAKLMFSHYQEKPGLHVVLQQIVLKFYEEASNSINLGQNDELEIEEAIKLGILVQKEEELSFQNLELLNEYLTHHIVNLILDNWNNVEVILKIHRKTITLNYKIISEVDLEHQVLLLLNKECSKNLVDLLIKASSLQKSQEMQYAYVNIYKSFWKILPQLKISVESVIRLLDFIDADFDKGNITIYQGIEEFAAQNKDIAENLYSSLLSRADKAFAILLCNVILAIARSDFPEAHKRALTFCDQEESILRRVGI
ncbi:MAG: type II toxin-antitoxin system HicB family antitoxin, partial [Cyanobacteria bacterium P01_F01_bin.143]